MISVWVIFVNFFQISSMLESARSIGGKSFNQLRKQEGTFSTEGTVCIKVFMCHYTPITFVFWIMSTEQQMYF